MAYRQSSRERTSHTDRSCGVPSRDDPWLVGLLIVSALALLALTLALIGHL
jgi:hypothetical protein